MIGLLILLGYALAAGTWTAIHGFRLRDKSPRLIVWDEWTDEDGTAWAKVEVRKRLFGHRVSP